mgnify:CR=1 FL=1
MENMKEIWNRKLSESDVTAEECRAVYELYLRKNVPMKFEGLYAAGDEKLQKSTFEVQVENQCIKFSYSFENGVEYEFDFSVKGDVFGIKAYPENSELRIGQDQHLRIIISETFAYNTFMMIIKYTDYMFEQGLIDSKNPVDKYIWIPEDDCNNIESVFKQCYVSGKIKKLKLGKGKIRVYANGDIKEEFVGDIDLNIEITPYDYIYGATIREFNEDSCSLDYKQYLSCKDTVLINAVIAGSAKRSVKISCDIKLLVDNTINGIYIENVYANVNILLDSKKDYEDALAYIYIATRYTDYSHLIIESRQNTHENENIETNESLINSFEKLNNLVGLSSIKQDVRDLANFMKMQMLRQQKGLKTIPVSLHLVFSGNPGTGKTTIARILADIYKELGILSKGQLVEVDRSSLVAGYVGQTAIKTQQKINEAMGGILFIDEAYTLAKGENDYGQEAIDTILKAMEDHRNDFVVIVAGYSDLMLKFVNSNPGLRSRFNKFINFPDYSAEELISIFLNMCKEYDFTLSEEATEVMQKKISAMVKNKDINFANARDIRNLFEKVVTKQATRLSGMCADDIMRIEAEDFE